MASSASSSTTPPLASSSHSHSSSTSPVKMTTEQNATPSSTNRDSAVPLSQLQTCDRYIEETLKNDRTIHFLLQHLEETMKCKLPTNGFLQCVDCQGKQVSGGFGMLLQTTTTEITTTASSSTTQSISSTHRKEEDKQSISSLMPSSSSKTSNDRSSLRKDTPDCNSRSYSEMLQQQEESFSNINKMNNNHKNKKEKEEKNNTLLQLQPEIYVCAEHVHSSKHVATIITHELIHAIDYCRTVNMDPIHNCLQLACTEIRAENLSGECNMKWEFLRGKLNPSSILGHGQECVQRRAIDSVKANPNCSQHAAAYVEAAMQRCYADTFPFERHPNQR